MGLLDRIIGGSKPSHPFEGWEEIESADVPHWVPRHFKKWIPLGHYIDVRGRHFIYRHWNDPANVRQQGDDGEDRYFKKQYRFH